MSQVFPIVADPRYRILSATAGQTVFAIGFPFQSNGDVKVYRKVDTEYVIVPSSDYTVTGAGNPSGGTLSFSAGRSAGEQILILGSAVLERLTSIVLNGRFNSLATDNELDRNRIIQQEVSREVSRAVKASYGEEAPTLDLAIPDGAVLIKQGNRLTAGPTGAAINSAQGYATAAGNSATAAGNSASAAATAKTDAEAARDLAQKFATNPEDSVVTGGLYSAFHWAQKAAAVVLAGLVDLSVTTIKIANGAVTQAKLAADIVSGWSAKSSVVSGDQILIADSAAGNAPKKVTFANFSASISTIPAGAVISVAQSTAPTGYLKANGAAVSRTTYAALFAAIGTTFGAGDGSTTFNLPDLRGEFIRGLDDSRGVDTARALGSAQSDQNKSHTHTGTAASAGAHTHTRDSSTAAGTGTTAIARGGTSSGQNVTTADSAGAHTHTLTIDADGGTEARPRNVALLYCIKF